MKIKKYKLLSLVFILFLFSCKDNNEFTLNGIIKANNIESIAIASGFISSEFYQYEFAKDESEIINENFIIEGKLKYPHPFYLITNTGSISGLFFLEDKVQSVKLDSLDLSVTPKILNSITNDEYLNKYLPLEEKLNNEDNEIKARWNDSLSDSLKSVIRLGRKNIREEKDKILIKYIKDNPDSYVGMWLLARNFTIYGYKDIYRSAFENLSDKLKETYSGIQIKSKMEISSISSINGTLPEAVLIDYDGKEHAVTFNKFNSEYILVDFWGSYCGPCIRDFPTILKMYNSSNRKKFDVIAISIDEKETIKAWQKIIEKENFPWSQYLDKEQMFSKKLMINAVPANFLLDSNGKIIMKNFSVEELEEILVLDNKNLKY
ncbi:MAG: thioredoxin-like domain-containing protein [Xanthomarina gelatinilytica]|uniref:thioredoxin-like domain-containing protein n=1 Tax=Xanthomarina gelatinilytica TaxID=1137281 RepID=UPI003A8ACA88